MIIYTNGWFTSSIILAGPKTSHFMKIDKMSFYIYQLHMILIQNYFILNIVLKICTVFYFLKQYRYTSKKSWIWAVEYFLQKKNAI